MFRCGAITSTTTSSSTPTADDRRCRCGSEYLAEDRSITRVRHTLSCFLGKHDYEKLADRDGCHEYVCTQCGHPLLFDAEHDPYAASPTFKKKVRYLCGLFGHRVAPRRRRATGSRIRMLLRPLIPEGDWTRPVVATRIRHPAICVVAGHFIHFLTKRGGFRRVCLHELWASVLFCL